MKNLIGLMTKGFTALMLALPLAVSCFDDSELWDAIDQLEMRVDSLENNLNAQMQVMTDLLAGKKNMVISDCVMNSDSSYVVTLSNGTTFTVLPQNASVSSLVSVITVDGKNYWATYDAVGVLAPLTDLKAMPIPVDMAIDVKVVDGEYYLVVAGKEFKTGYDTEDLVQVFESCEPHKDASGNVYAMTFDFGGGVTVTVSVDGYKGVLFKSSKTGSTLEEYFLYPGTSQTFYMDCNDVVDYVMQIPDGWRVTEMLEQHTGDLYVTISAPSYDAVQMGAAVPSGDLKVVSVVEGGKAVVTRLALSTEPFKAFTISSHKAIVEPYAGVEQFAYGLCELSGFDEDNVIAKVNEHFSMGAALPDGYFISEISFNKTHEEIYPELQEGGQYMFWAVPLVMKNAGTDDEAFYAPSEMLKTYSLVPTFFEMKVSDVTLLDAQLKLRIIGAPSIYAGVTLRDENVVEEIVYQINNGGFDPMDDPELFTYEGPASEFPDKNFATYMEPNTTYVAWVVPVEEGKTEYAATDVEYVEFTTLEVRSGGSLKAAFSAPSTDCSSISMTVSCNDAAMIYYAYLDADTGERNQTFGNETKWNVLTGAETFNAVRGTSVEAVIDELMPETTMWLYAVAIGHDGLYGDIACKSAATSSVSFNSLTVNVTSDEILAKEATFSISVSGGTATDYIYWVGRTSSEFWTQKCLGNVESAQKFMAANPDSDIITKVMNSNGAVTGGKLSVSDLTVAKEHVIVVLAKDASGSYSKAGQLTFNTASVFLGDNFVAEGSDKWNETKTWIEDNIVWHKNEFRDSEQLSGYYSFDIKIPQYLNASISTCYPENFNSETADITEKIVALEKYCAEPRDVTYLNGYELSDAEKEKFNLVDANGEVHNASVFMQMSDYYPHGAPKYGRFTYFSSIGHNETTCILWDNICPNYHEEEQKISEKLDVEYWKSWVMTSWYSDTYGRVFNDEEEIAKFAVRAVEVYSSYYTGKKPIVYVNDGSAQKVINSDAVGTDENGNVGDKVHIILKDNNGNYYAPMTIDVPNYF